MIIYSGESTLNRESLKQNQESDFLGSHQIYRHRKHAFLNHQSTRLDLAEENVETRRDSVFSQRQRDSCSVVVGRAVYPI